MPLLHQINITVADWIKKIKNINKKEKKNKYIKNN
jgi:hypothetical protein